MRAMKQLSLRDEILLEACEDDVALSAILWALREDFQISDEHERRVETMAILSELLHSGLVEAGNFVRVGNLEGWNTNPMEAMRRKDSYLLFDAWKLSAAQTLCRIEAEWNALGREPRAGDIAYFVGTARGKQGTKTL
jgi:hypothetical protein